MLAKKQMTAGAEPQGYGLTSARHMLAGCSSCLMRRSDLIRLSNLDGRSYFHAGMQ